MILLLGLLTIISIIIIFICFDFFLVIKDVVQVSGDAKLFKVDLQVLKRIHVGDRSIDWYNGIAEALNAHHIVNILTNLLYGKRHVDLLSKDKERLHLLEFFYRRHELVKQLNLHRLHI